MDLISVDPLLNLYDEHWPIRTYQPNCRRRSSCSPKKGPNARRGQALDSIVCQGSIISGGQVERSILGPTCRINSYAQVEDSILFDGVDVGRHAKVRRAIIDKGVHIPAGHRDRLRPRARPRPRLHRDRGRRDRDRQGRRRRAFPRSRTARLQRRQRRLHARKKSPRKDCVPGGQRTATFSGSDWTLALLAPLLDR